MKIYIIGIVASGKTTIARKMSKEINIDWFELDTITHVNTAEGRFKRTADEQMEIIRDINNTGNWIIEGTYRASCHALFDMADKIIYVDTALSKRVFRILFRYIKQQLKIEHCHYKSNLYMLKLMFKWTKDFEKNRSNFNRMLDEYKSKIICLKGNENVATICGFVKSS